jgi:hypothetical protein
MEYEKEDRVVYSDGDEIRSVRGRLRPDDGSDFVVLDRRDDSVIRINKRDVHRIEEGI